MPAPLVERIEQSREAVLHPALLSELASLGDAELWRTVRSLGSLVNTVQAVQAHAIAQLGHRARADDDAKAAEAGFYGPHGAEEHLADELALTLSTTTAAASYLYDRAMMTGKSPSVMVAWREGRIDSGKAESIAHTYAVCGESLSDEALELVMNDAIDYATTRTAPQLREWLRRREISADPAAAERRRQRARDERRVTIRHVADGMSELWALLPSVGARAIQQILDQTAKEAGASEHGSMDARRADALVELITGEIDPPATQVHVVVPVHTLTDNSLEPAWLPGVGPMTADEFHSLQSVSAPGSSDTTFRRLLCDPASGHLVDLAESQYRPSRALDRAVRARDVTCRFPSCRRSALGSGHGTDLDHTVPWPQGLTAASNLTVLCRRHHRLKHSPGWKTVLHTDGTMTWTTPSGRQYTSEPWMYTDPSPPERPPPSE